MRYVIAIAGLLGACEPVSSPAPSTIPVTPPQTHAAVAAVEPERDARFVAPVLAAARAYRAWGRVDATPHEAPAPCAFGGPTPTPVQLSAAEVGPHGKKLYYLWASDPGLYRAGRGEVPAGFAIVKESFAAVPQASADAPPTPTAEKLRAEWAAPTTTFTTPDGHHLGIGEPTGLFVMVKVGPGAGTDDGWVYGTVTAEVAGTGSGAGSGDGTGAEARVLRAGRIASCMKCHDARATRERLFGLRPVRSSGAWDSSN